MRSIVTTFREAVIKVEVANFGAAIDTLIDQDANILNILPSVLDWNTDMECNINHIVTHILHDLFIGMCWLSELERFIGINCSIHDPEIFGRVEFRMYTTVQ